MPYWMKYSRKKLTILFDKSFYETSFKNEASAFAYEFAPSRSLSVQSQITDKCLSDELIICSTV